jgi:hypothetical protein
LHQLLRQRVHARDLGIVLELRGLGDAGDDGGHGGLIEDPTERQVRQTHPGGEPVLDLVGELDALVEGQAREGLADIEGLAVAVVSAVVLRGELGGFAHLARQQTRGERQADDDADIVLLRQREDLADVILPEQVEDHLQRRAAVGAHGE